LFRNKSYARTWQLTTTHLCCWENRIPEACLAVAFINNTAKLLQLSRISNAGWAIFSSPNSTNAMLAAVFHQASSTVNLYIDYFQFRILPSHLVTGAFPVAYFVMHLFSQIFSQPFSKRDVQYEDTRYYH